VLHLAKTFELANEAGLLLQPDLAARRMGQYLSVNGVSA
jgi:hypothetical protein